MNDEVKKEVLDFIRLKTGAASAFVFLSTATHPCNQEKEGLGCVGHLSTDFYYGIDKVYLPGLLHDLFEELTGGSDDKEDDGDGGVLA